MAADAQPTQQPWTLQQLTELHFGHAPSRILKTALELDVFSHLAKGKKTAAELARAARASDRGMRMLLDALTGLQLLTNHGGEYGLTPAAAQFLLRDSDSYVGDFLDIEQIWQAWGNLTESVRTGRPYQPVESEEEGAEFFRKLVRGLHVVNRESAHRAAEFLCTGNPRAGLRVLDVGCGSGVWSIAVAEADPRARVTAQDFPGVLETTREYLRRHGVEDRYEFLPGDLNEVDLGEGLYDLALLGHIVHSEGERSSRDLFRRLFRALRPGGRVAVAEFIPNDERTGSPLPLIFALNMLVNTEEGDAYTLRELTQWFREAGFARVETADVASHSPLVIAHKQS